jgi:chaperonin GroEL
MKLEKVEISMLGKAKKIIATKDDTTIIGGKGKKKDIDARVAQIKLQIEKSDSDYDKEKLQTRMAKLAGGVAVIKVGAASETELNYMKHKMDDALAATRAAVEEGIVAGGGTALAKAVAAVKARKEKFEDNEYRSGYETLLSALNEPLKQIAANTGKQDPAVVLNKIIENKNANYGYDARKDKFEVDMIKAGIIDPLKVTRTAIENAVSVAAMFLTTEAAVADKPEKKCSCADGGSAMPNMGGMM